MMNDFPYRARAMFAFEEQDGVDVCFFGMHVQVYINQCSAVYQCFNAKYLCRSTAASVPSQIQGGSTSPIWTLSISSSRGTSELQFIMKYY